jgi:site-specific DNA recombinase
MSDDKPTIRCAIYTRKSKEEGLEQDFNSLDAQRQAGEAFIASQVGEGWVCLPEHYDDGGYTGGNTERPALQRLLIDIKAGLIDCVVVYKVDRLSRSLLDFAKIMGILEACNVAFVSVTQSFNSANSMGRLTLNILLSFAQFEREVISERTRDKIGMARKKGKWSGGTPVLGYDVVPEGGRIVINEVEAEQVRAIFDLYLELGGMLKVVDELECRGWANKTWITRSGKLHQGKPFNKGMLHYLLTNPIYTGNVRHHGKVYPGEHDAILSQETFDRVQKMLASNRREEDPDRHFQGDAILRGILRCKACDCGMVNSHSTKGNRRYRYYLCHNAQSRGWRHCPRPTLPAQEIERFVVEEICAIGQDDGLIQEVVEETRRIQAARIEQLSDTERLLKQELKGYAKQARDLEYKPFDPRAAAALDSAKERIGQIEREIASIHAQLADLRAANLADSDVAEACRLFHPVWDVLTSREQRRIIRLLIERIDFDAAEETIAITFNPTGIKALRAEHDRATEEAAVQ